MDLTNFNPSVELRRAKTFGIASNDWCIHRDGEEAFKFRVMDNGEVHIAHVSNEKSSILALSNYGYNLGCPSLVWDSGLYYLDGGMYTIGDCWFKQGNQPSDEQWILLNGNCELTAIGGPVVIYLQETVDKPSITLVRVNSETVTVHWGHTESAKYSQLIGDSLIVRNDKSIGIFSTSYIGVESEVSRDKAGFKIKRASSRNGTFTFNSILDILGEGNNAEWVTSIGVDFRGTVKINKRHGRVRL